MIKSGSFSEPATNFIFYGTDGDPSTASKLGWANSETSVFHFLDTPVNYQDKALYQDREAAFSRPMFLPGKFSSGAQSCLTLCNPMDYSTQSLRVHHQLSEFTQTHVHWVGDAIQPSHSLLSSCLQSFPASGCFQMSQFFASGGQNIGVSASASVLPMNIQDWFPLGWTGWISLLSKGLSRVFSNTTVQKHPFFGPQLSL